MNSKRSKAAIKPAIQYQFTGKDMTLVTSSQRLPNKRWINLEMITHPGAVCIAPFLSREQIILLWQYRPVFKTYLYELPAGTLDKKEAPLPCARRELLEETGYTAKRWERKGRIYPVPGYSDEEIIIYKAQGLTFRKSEPEADEVIEARPLALGQIRKLFLSGKIIDAKTICALTFCGIL